MKWLCFVVSFLSVAYAVAGEVEPGDYEFPFKNRYVATILARTSHSDVSFKKFLLPVRSDRSAVPGFKNSNKITLGLFIHKEKKSRPLAFVIAGTGSDAISANSLQLASEIFEMGYNAISLPNPVSQEYALAVSEKALPGYLPRDSVEYYELLKLVAKTVEKNENLTTSQYLIVGYSLSGLLTGYLLNLDNQLRAFKFSKAVIINPALDLDFGVQVLDGFYANGTKLSRTRKVEVAAALQSLIEVGKRREVWTEQLHKMSSFGDAELQWLIGYAFHQRLCQVIFASQQVNDLGILKPANLQATSKRKAAACKFNFQQYMTQFLLPSLAHDTKEFGALVQAADIYSLSKILTNDPRVYVLENSDDILLKPGDIDFLRGLAGPHLTLYPYGGHLGNLRFKKNQIDLRTILSQ